MGFYVCLTLVSSYNEGDKAWCRTGDNVSSSVIGHAAGGGDGTMKNHMAWLGGQGQSYKKYMGICAFCGFAAGIFAANTFAKKTITDIGLFGDYFFMQIQNTKIDSGAMFGYVFEKRMLFCLVFMMFGVTSVGTIACYVLAGWLGISVGMLFSAAVIQRGMEGLGICILGMLPQYLFYVPAGIMLMLKTCQMSARLYNREAGYYQDKKKEFTAYLLVLIVVAALFFAGILLESFVNPIFLQKFYKIFNNM